MILGYIRSRELTVTFFFFVTGKVQIGSYGTDEGIQYQQLFKRKVSEPIIDETRHQNKQLYLQFGIRRVMPPD